MKLREFKEILGDNSRETLQYAAGYPLLLNTAEPAAPSRPTQFRFRKESPPVMGRVLSLEQRRQIATPVEDADNFDPIGGGTVEDDEVSNFPTARLRSSDVSSGR